MSAFPKTCPRCGAGLDADMPERYWACGSSPLHPHPRQMSCYEREADQIRARVRELEARVENLQAARTHTDRLLRYLVLTLRAAQDAASHAEPGEAHRAIVQAIEAIFTHAKEAKP